MFYEKSQILLSFLLILYSIEILSFKLQIYTVYTTTL